MPLLDLASLEGLNREPPKVCDECRRAVRKNYCRQCDEYFEAGHLPLGKPEPDDPRVSCADHAKHDSHRTY